MAKFFPSQPREGAPGSELRVWNSLTSLNDDWGVFHSVAWQSVRDGREGDGEADFVLLHPQFGIVVLEVKGGEVTIEKGIWHSLNRGTGVVNRIKNPFMQAMASKHALLKYLGDAVPGGYSGSVCHGVVLPDIAIDRFLGLEAPRDIAWDATDLLRINEALDRLLAHWDAHASLSKAEVGRITQMLAPTTTLRSGLRAQVAGTLAEQIELTLRQIQALDGLRRNRRALVMGGAGTGKTILAIERARRLASEGFDVLLTCYNRPLADHIAEELRDETRVAVATFHSLCLAEAAGAKIGIPSEPTQSWWQDAAANTLVTAAELTGHRFSAIVIDEGQDFNSAWVDALQLMLVNEDEDPIYVFTDTLQALFDRDWAVPPAWPVFELDINCRNTRQIAARVAALFDTRITTLSADGPKPQFVLVRDEAELLSVLPDLVDGLLSSEGFMPTQCAVLTASSDLARTLRESSTSEYAFVPLGKHGVLVETTQRFKGLESEVVLLPLHAIDLATTEGKALAYVGMSRARALLFVLGTRSQREELGWGVAAAAN